jgi:hypothetical protein
MSHLAIPAPVASTLPEQAITASLTAEVMNDLDDGLPTLVASTEGNQGDLGEVSPSTLMCRVREARAKLDEIEQLARDYAATHTLPAFVDHFGIRLVERGMDTMREHLGPELAEKFGCVALHRQDGGFTVIVPEGQDPLVRLAVVRELVRDLQEQADAA